MKKFLTTFLILALLCTCAFGLTACGEEDYVGVFRQEYHLLIAEVEIKANKTATYTVWTVDGEELTKGDVLNGTYDSDKGILTVVVEGVSLEAHMSEDKQTLTMYNPAYSTTEPVMILTRVPKE